MNLGIEPRAWDALERFIESPVAAADKDGNAVDADGQRVGAGNAVSDFSNAEADVLLIGNLLLYLEAQMEFQQILRPVAIGPPQRRMVHVQCGKLLCIE